MMKKKLKEKFNKTMNDIVDKVKENNIKLDNCSRHNFVCVSSDQNTFKRYQCLNCGGFVSNSDKTWYEKGLEHGLKTGENGDD